MVLSSVSVFILLVSLFFAFGGSGLVFLNLPYFKRVRQRLTEVDTLNFEFPACTVAVKAIRKICGQEVAFTHWFPDLVRDLEGGIARTLGVTVLVQIGWIASLLLANLPKDVFKSNDALNEYAVGIWNSVTPVILISFLVALLFLAILVSAIRSHFIKYRDVVYPNK